MTAEHMQDLRSNAGRKKHRAARWIAVAAVPVAVVALAACSSSKASTGSSSSTNSAATSSGSTAPAKKLTFAVMNYGEKFPFTASIYKGMQQAASVAGVTLTDFDAAGTVATQLNQVKEIISLKPDGVLFMPIDSAASVSMAAQLKAAGIPVVAVATAVGPANAAANYVDPNLVALVNQDEVATSTEAGKLAAQAVPKGGDMAVILGAPGNAADTQRYQNFQGAAKAAGVTLNVVSQVTGGWVASTSESACQNVLSAHPKIDLIYAESDDMAVGCSQAVTAAHSSAKVIGVGGEAVALGPLKTGTSPIFGTVCYKPVDMGALAFTTLFGDVNGSSPKSAAFVTYTTPGVTHASAGQCVPQW